MSTSIPGAGSSGRPAPLRERLEVTARSLHLPVEVVESDYALGCVLAAICSRAIPSRTLVLRGGAALRKAYFSDHRLAYALDFVAIGGLRGDKLTHTMEAAARFAEHLLSDRGAFVVTSTRHPEEDPRVSGRESFLMSVRFPWGRPDSEGASDETSGTVVDIPVTMTVDETPALLAERRTLLHPYEETPLGDLLVCRLEEILADTLRALLLEQKRVDQGAWPTDCSCHYYDLWRLLRLEEGALDFSTALAILPEKCASRGVSFEGADDFFSPLLVGAAEEGWEAGSCRAAGIGAAGLDFDTLIAGARAGLRGLLG